MSKKSVFLLVMAVLAGGFVALWRVGNPEKPAPDSVPEAGSQTSSEPPATGLVAEDEEVVESQDAIPGEAPEGKEAVIAGERESANGAGLRPAVREVLEGDSYTDRLRAVKYDMPESLEAREFQGLEDYLLVPQTGRDGDFRQHEYALRNYMMDALRGEESRTGETIGTLVSVYADESQGDVMRGYALQHLASVYIGNVSKLSAADKSRIVKTFKAALADTSAETLAGTALLGLQDASRWDPDTVSPSMVGHAAMGLLQSDASGTLSKISAFQICGELKRKAAAPYARETAFDPSADWVLRMAAVYALSQLGETTGLETLLNDSDKHVAKAVAVALNAQR